MTASRIVVMGPSGSGKSAVGAALAAHLGMRFVDADDLHPAQNVAKMAAGTPLEDDDRMPWLDLVAQTLAASQQPVGGDAASVPPPHGGVVIACSALARRYRERILAGAAGTVFIELRVPERELARRMGARDHFMPPALLASQLRALEHLEPDEPGVVVAGDPALGEVVETAVAALERYQSLR